MQKYDKNDNLEQSSLTSFIKSAPTLLLISMMLSFIIMLAVQLFYYQMVFTDLVPAQGLSYFLAAAIALMFQAARFSFGIAGAYEFAKGEKSKGAFGLLFSLSLTVFESFEVSEMTAVWLNTNVRLVDTLNMVLQAVLWLGFALEIRLLTNVAGTAVEAPEGHTDSRIEEKTANNVNFTKATQPAPSVARSANGVAHQ